jgi:hypothetical protein
MVENEQQHTVKTLPSYLDLLHGLLQGAANPPPLPLHDFTFQGEAQFVRGTGPQMIRLEMSSGVFQCR